MLAIQKQHASWIAENILVVPLAAIIAGAIAYWVMVTDRRPPFDLSNGTVTPSEVRSIDTFQTNWKRTMLRSGDFEATCTRDIVDSIGTIHSIDQPKASTAPGPFDPRLVQVPVAASWGPARWRVKCCYRMTGVSLTRVFPVCVERPELPFTILPPVKP